MVMEPFTNHCGGNIECWDGEEGDVFSGEANFFAWSEGISWSGDDDEVREEWDCLIVFPFIEGIEIVCSDDEKEVVCGMLFFDVL